MQAGTTTLEISLAVPQRTGHNTSRGPRHTPPGHIPRRFPSMQEGYMLHYVHSSLIYNSQKLEGAQISLKGEMDTKKMWYIYTMEYYSAIRNNEFMKFLDKWMELENIILSEVTQSQKINHGMHSLISGY